MGLKSPANQSWSDAWKLYKGEHDSLLATMRGMQGGGLSREDAEDLLHSFVLQRLPRIADLTRRMTEAERGRYLRASLRNYVRTAVRLRHHRDLALQQISAELSLTSSDKAGDAQLRVEVMPALTRLPPEETEALQLYLGIDGPPRSIREIAEQLGRSRHGAKQLIVNGLVGAAIALGENGALSPVDVEACRNIVLNGASIAETARKLAISRERVRRSLHRARDWAMARLAKTDLGDENEHAR